MFNPLGLLALRRYLPYLRPYAGLVAVFGMAQLGSLATAASIPKIIQYIIDGPVTHRRLDQLVQTAGLLLISALAEFLFIYLRRNYSGAVSLRMETDLRDDFYAHLQSLQVSFHDNWQSGQLLSRAVSDIATVRRFVSFGLIWFLQTIVTFAVVFVLMMELDWKVAIVVTLFMLPIAYFSNKFHDKYKPIARRLQDQQGDLTTIIEEMATGVRIIKAFGRMPLMQKRFEDQAGLLRTMSLEGIKARALLWTQINSLPNLSLVAVLLLGGYNVVQGTLTIGGLIAFMNYVFMLTWPMDAIGYILSMSEECQTASQRLNEVLDSRPEIADHPGARALERARAGMVGDLRPRVEHLVQALRCRLALLAHREDVTDRVHGPREHEHVVHERDQAADGQRPLHDVVAAEQQDRDQREVREEVDLCPQQRARLDPLEAHCSQQPGLVLEALLHQGHAPERLDDADAGGHLLDDRGEVTLLVLQAARDRLVLVMELVAEVSDGKHEQRHHDRHLPVELHHQYENDRERHDRLQEPDQPEAHEAADRGDIGDRARQQLPRLPGVVEGNLQRLQVRVEVVAQVGLHAQRDGARVVAAQVDEKELRQGDDEQQARRLHELVQTAMRDRPVDDVLNDLRDRGGRGEAAQLRHPEDGDEPGVGPQVREIAPQRQQTQGVEHPSRLFFLGARN